MIPVVVGAGGILTTTGGAVNFNTLSWSDTVIASGGSITVATATMGANAVLITAGSATLSAGTIRGSIVCQSNSGVVTLSTALSGPTTVNGTFSSGA